MNKLIKANKLFEPRKNEIIDQFKNGELTQSEAAKCLTGAQEKAWLDATGSERKFDYSKWYDLLPLY